MTHWSKPVPSLKIKNQTLPIKDYYKASNILIEIKGDDSIEEVSSNIFNSI